ncbi:MAG: IS200/IS605 family transposase [Candidatus Methanomethyliaceae archaeon]
MEYQQDRTKVFLINYHLVWTPKRRKPVLVGKIKERLEQVIKETAEERGIGVLSLVVNPDHVHLFVSANPMVPAHKIVKEFKGRSSRVLRQEFPELLKLPSLWTRSYFVSTDGNVSPETIQKYIEAQSRK